jgi:hypothetical protein
MSAMMKRVFISLLLLVLGAFLTASGYKHWSADPVRGYLPMEGVVLDHHVLLNRQRWEEDVPKAMEVETRVGFLDKSNPPYGLQGAVVIHDYFARGESAWDFANSEPLERKVKCLVSPNREHGIRDGIAPSGPMMAMIVGSLIMLAGIVMHLPLRPPSWGHSAVVVAALLAFFIGGVVMSSQMWPVVIKHVKAADWDLVPCQIVSHRSYRSGKSTTHELLVRYSAAGGQHETVLNGAFFDLGGESRSAKQCRVNPSKPWQVTLSWGWRPGLGVALFPVPFLTVGLLGLFIPFSTLLQQQIKSKQTWEKLSLGRWGEVVGQGFALLFVGSIVGVFLSLCAEMWLQAHEARWFLTLFLIPFVCWVLKLAWMFISGTRKALHS